MRRYEVVGVEGDGDPIPVGHCCEVAGVVLGLFPVLSAEAKEFVIFV